MKKKLLSVGLATVMGLSLPAVISASPATTTTAVESSVVANDSIVLNGEIGTVIEHGGLTFVRVESTPEPTEPIITPFASKTDFSISLSGTEKSQAFTLDKDYPYVKVYINNTSSSGHIIFTITKNSSTGSVVSGSSVTIPANAAWNVYSTNAWTAGTYYANFTSGKTGLSGSSYARLASTYAELDI
ncbi:hypothetical protein [Paenibacillus sp. FSL K6-0108]|uniref:hypothetical protein n=1 Tax=Paenibacillus sp. FSL K6-0108 TaxID=2921417 RepID=UPI0032491E14